MSQRVVDLLETIHVKEHQRYRAVTSLGPHYRALEPFVQ
jgi:hypothetical protein